MKQLFSHFVAHGRMIIAGIRKKIKVWKLIKTWKAKRKKGFVEGITDKLIDKAEELIDEPTNKIYKSEPYKKAGNSIEKATLNIFRKAGKWWGKL